MKSVSRLPIVLVIVFLTFLTLTILSIKSRQCKTNEYYGNYSDYTDRDIVGFNNDANFNNSKWAKINSNFIESKDNWQVSDIHAHDESMHTYYF